MIPNALWMALPPANDPMAGMRASLPVLDSVAAISRVLMIALLVFLVPRKGRQGGGYVGLASLCLAGYYASWVADYLGIAHPLMLVGMAVLPSVFFVTVGLWLGNDVSVVPGVLFGITHTASACLSLLK